MMKSGNTLANGGYVSGEFTFRPIQSWDSRTGTPTQCMERMSMENIEEGMESKPFGINTPIDEILCICTEDLYLDMKERQVEYVSPANYSQNASYLPYRRYLVDWMSDVGEQCRLHNSTVHVAILFLDKIFRSRNISRGQWQLLATACISVAAKYEEAEEYCPPIPDLLRLTKLGDAGHTPLSFREGELEVLRYLNWQLRAIPPIHIIGYFLAKGVTFNDDAWQGRALIQKIPRYVKKYAEFFCNLTLQEYSFQQYLPSLLGAAIILASRVALNIEPRWKTELVTLTGYNEVEITDAFHHVWSYYEEQFPGHGSRSISPRSVTNMYG
mmetsp:Transcript_19847/g.43078  ORF Transcript_19847/g.43078 Transcript_19847/m.43078 type:complete len:327 (+) Transcript_19847:90-1070(+)|eukprot:CAMPEP_0168194146 /NCGR_PEP_ID=MMETSP0139_2-20121125/19019_1 /TAXON_ID=44445 /ORGANISM="Pseudo-nitzschia australis, Strain 10249 10 AB" /LENGTH=326 /DNA_ID=CAMNT_0008117619 /DNA_START=37 /DNA_END=1017 /DNA_ORIENTATION=-